MENITMANDCRYQDRRQSMPFFCAFHLGIKAGRRTGERRITPRKENYVDYYENNLMICVVGILLLSTMDAFFTLNILAYGGEELNWFMSVLIEDSVEKFIGVKFALTALALVLLVIHHNVQLTRRIRVKHLKYMILAGYSLLIGYEIHLLQLATAA